MTTTRTLISLAIILALPFSANATGPAHDSGNSPVVATASAPYQTVTPDAHADEHIASTAYVIGAYNDAIAAVNKVDSDKQDKLMNTESTPQPISNNVISGGDVVTAFKLYVAAPEFMYALPEISSDLNINFNDSLMTAGATVEVINAGLLQIDSAIDSALDYMADDLFNKRVEIYTTWDDDTEKTQVAFVDASAQ